MNTYSRRTFLTASSTLLACRFSLGQEEPEKSEAFRFGLVTDAHYADRKPGGSRHYSESLTKMRECVDFMNEQQVAFLAELGDLKDQTGKPVEADTLKFLETIEAEFGKFKGPRYHVLGNHDVDSIAKEQFLARVTNTGIAKDRTYYAFDQGGLHVVVLDACFRKDGVAYDHGNFNWTDAVVPQEELDWLEADLKSTERSTVVLAHQLLDGEGAHYVKNAAKVRQVLEQSGKVAAVFQGHQHAGDYHLMEGIHYLTQKAMVEGAGEANSAYAIVEVLPDAGLKVTGYRRAVSKHLTTPGA